MPRGTAAWVDFGEVLPHLDSTLMAQPYLAGHELTLADVLFGGAFAFFAQNPHFPSTPAIRDYTARCTGDRPGRAPWRRTAADPHAIRCRSSSPATRRAPAAPT